jgi:PAS domain S-box-containing protein
MLCVLALSAGIALTPRRAVAQDRPGYQSEARLPADSTLPVKERGAWDRYERYIIGDVLLVLLQAALIAALLVQRRRRLHTERELRESEERFRLMADTAPVLVWRAGVDKRCDFFNRPWLEFTGRTMEQELGDGWAQGIHPADFEECLRVYHRGFDAREPFRMEYRLRRADGEYRWILDSGVPRTGPAGKFAGYIGSCIDITDRKQAEDALRESQQRYALASSAGGVGVWDWNIETGHIYVDRSLKAILGFDDAEISSRVEDWGARVHPGDTARITAYAQLCVDGDTDGFEAEHRMLHKDGSVRWFLSRGSMIRSADGAPLRMVGTDVDITERKRSEEQFGRAIEAAPAGMIMVDSAGTIVMVNSQIEKLFGYSRQELVGQPVETLVPERFRDRHPAYRGSFHGHPTARIGGDGRGLFGVRKDGVEFPVEIGLNPFTTPDGTFVLGSVTDITARYATQRENEELMAQLQRVTGRLIVAQETERSRIARDLHDDVSQQIAGLSIALSSLKRRIGTQPEDRRLATDLSLIQERTASVADNIRHLSHDLHSSVLEHAGLVAALSSHCAETQRLQTVAVVFRSDGEFDDIEPAAALCLYRVAQEALRNVVAHANAREAAVRLIRVDGIAELTIADDGRGFDIAQARTRSEGLGLVSISERVRLAGGTASIVTEHQKGTWLRVRVPVVRRPQAPAAYPLPSAEWLTKPLTRT